MPCESFEVFKFAVEFSCERFEVDGVAYGVLQLGRGQRSLGPVGSLACLGEFDVEEVFDHCVESELFVSEHLGGEHCVEDLFFR